MKLILKKTTEALEKHKCYESKRPHGCQKASPRNPTENAHVRLRTAVPWQGQAASSGSSWGPKLKTGMTDQFCYFEKTETGTWRVLEMGWKTQRAGEPQTRHDGERGNLLKGLGNQTHSHVSPCRQPACKARSPLAIAAIPNPGLRVSVRGQKDPELDAGAKGIHFKGSFPNSKTITTTPNFWIS